MVSMPSNESLCKTINRNRNVIKQVLFKPTYEPIAIMCISNETMIGNQIIAITCCPIMLYERLYFSYHR